MAELNDIMLDVKKSAQEAIAQDESMAQALSDLFKTLSTESKEFLASLGVTASQISENKEEARKLLEILEQVPKVSAQIAAIQKATNTDYKSAITTLRESLALTQQLLSAQEKLSQSEKRRLQDTRSSLQAIRALEIEELKKVERIQEDIHRRNLDRLRREQEKFEEQAQKYRQKTSIQNWFMSSFGGRGTGTGSLMGNVDTRDLLSVIAGRYSPFVPYNQGSVGGIGGDHIRVQMQRALDSAKSLKDISEYTRDTSETSEKELRTTQESTKQEKEKDRSIGLKNLASFVAAGALGAAGIGKSIFDTLQTMKTPEGFLKGLTAPIGAALGHVSPKTAALFNTIVGAIIDAAVWDTKIRLESSIHAIPALLQGGYGAAPGRFHAVSVAGVLSPEETYPILEKYPRLGMQLAPEGFVSQRRLLTMAGLERMYGAGEVSGVIPSILAGKKSTFEEVISSIQKTFAVAKVSAQDFGLSVSNVSKWLAEASESARFLNVDSKYVHGTWLSIYNLAKELKLVGINIAKDGGKLLTDVMTFRKDLPFEAQAYFGSKIYQMYGEKSPNLFASALMMRMGKAAAEGLEYISKDGMAGFTFRRGGKELTPEEIERLSSKENITADTAKVILQDLHQISQAAKTPQEKLTLFEKYGEAFKIPQNVLYYMLWASGKGVDFSTLAEKATQMRKEQDPVEALKNLTSAAQYTNAALTAINQTLLGIFNAVVLLPTMLRAWWEGGRAEQEASKVWDQQVGRRFRQALRLGSQVFEKTFGGTLRGIDRVNKYLPKYQKGPESTPLHGGMKAELLEKGSQPSSEDVERSKAMFDLKRGGTGTKNTSKPGQEGVFLNWYNPSPVYNPDESLTPRGSDIRYLKETLDNVVVALKSGNIKLMVGDQEMKAYIDTTIAGNTWVG